MKIIGSIESFKEWREWCDKMKEDPFKYGYAIVKEGDKNDL